MEPKIHIEYLRGAPLTGKLEQLDKATLTRAQPTPISNTWSKQMKDKIPDLPDKEKIAYFRTFWNTLDSKSIIELDSLIDHKASQQTKTRKTWFKSVGNNPGALKKETSSYLKSI